MAYELGKKVVNDLEEFATVKNMGYHLLLKEVR